MDNQKEVNMKKTRIRLYWIAIFIFITCNIPPVQILAEEDPKVVGLYSGQDYIQLYLNNVENDIKDINCRIASNNLDKEIIYSRVKESESKTLFLIDPSLSIKEEERNKFKELISNMIDDKTEKESFAIATYDSDLHYHCDYLKDRWEIMKAYESIEYRKTATDLTEVIYNLVKENNDKDDSSYKRIIIFTDGYDKAENITKDELYYLLSSTPYSIFTIGCNYDKNKEELKSLFALSRITNAESFQFNNDTDVSALQESLNKSHEYIGVRIIPDINLLDGSIKNVEIKITTDANEYIINKDVKMYMASERATNDFDDPSGNDSETDKLKNEKYDKISNSDIEDRNQDEDDEKNKKDRNSEDEDEEDESSSSFNDFIDDNSTILIGGAAGLLILCTTIILITIHKKKMKQKKNINQGNHQVQNEPRNFNTDIFNEPKNMEDDGNPTLILGSTRNGRQVNDNTPLDFINSSVLRFTLKDISNNKIFEKSVGNEIIIGRMGDNQDVSRLILDYDTSVSKNHCRIFIQNGDFYVEDLNSSNHTYLNDRMLTGVNQIRSGDILGIGRLKLRFTVL